MSNIDLDVRVRDKTAAALGNIDKRIKGLDKSMAGINTRGKLLVSTLAGLATGAVVKNIIGITARFQDLRTTLASVTGSAEEGAEAFEFINEFATKTQFGVEDLTNTFIKLTSNGIEPTEKLLTTFTDAAAVTTDQIGSLTALTDFYTRSLQAQQVSLQDLERLSDRGLPVYDILKEKLGITRGEISEFSKEAGNAAKVVEALGEGIDERFGGATQARIKNLSTQISNFKIALTAAADILGQGFSEALGVTIDDVTAFINKNDELIRQLGQDLGTGVEKSAKFIRGLGDEFATIKDAATDVVDGYNALPEFVKDVGILGAILLGTRGRLLLLALTGIIGSIKQQIDSISKTDFSIDPNLKGQKRLDALAESMDQIDERIQKIKDSNFGETLVIDTPGGEISAADLGLDMMDEYNDLQRQKRGLDMDAFQTSMALVTAHNKKTQAQNKDKDSLGELNNITLENTDVIKGNKDVIENMLKPYQDMIKLNDKLIIQDIGTPLEQAKKEYDRVKKAIGDVNRAMMALDPTLKEERDLMRELKDQLPGLNDSLVILEENMANLAAMESPFFEFGQHIKEQGDAMKQLGSLSSQVYDRMASDLTNFVMTGKFNFKSFSRFVIQELVKIAVQAALTFAIKSIAGAFGFTIPGLAKGGPVERDEMYMVGEEGPELFVPRKSGRIVPNHKLQSITSPVSDIVEPSMASPVSDMVEQPEPKPRRLGGPVRQGDPYEVGEAGPELFIPNGANRIVPAQDVSEDMVSRDSGQQEVNINFNITATDASSFDDLLVTRRSTIIGIINEGLNRQGKRSII